MLKMGLVNDLKANTYNFFIVTTLFNIIAWFSIFLYVMFYYLYIPPVDHVKPVFLQFDSVCKHSQGCHYPRAQVPLASHDISQVLCKGQKYVVRLDLEMPESQVNRQIGMFMIQINMTSRNGATLQSSSRPAIMQYKSGIIHYVQAIIYSPFVLSGTFEEKQMISVVLFEAYEENPINATAYIEIQIQNQMIEIYTAKLKIHAEFIGLRYFMYYWPLLTAFSGITSLFFFMSLIALFAWYHLLNGADETSTISINDSCQTNGDGYFTEDIVEEELLSTEEDTKHNVRKRTVQVDNDWDDFDMPFYDQDDDQKL